MARVVTRHAEKIQDAVEGEREVIAELNRQVMPAWLQTLTKLTKLGNECLPWAGEDGPQRLRFRTVKRIQESVREELKGALRRHLEHYR